MVDGLPPAPNFDSYPDYEEYDHGYAQDYGAPAKPEKPLVSATPYVWRDPSTIPPRPWLLGRWLLRGTVAAVVAPGGAGKSMFLAGTAMAMATGRDLLGKTVWEGPKRVWLWNLEDDLDELSRSIQSAALHFDLEPADIEGRLFVDSAMDGSELCTAIEGPEGFQLLAPVYEALTAELRRREIDVLIVDPFVSSHGAEENHNSKIDAIAKAWARVAKAANACIILAHHTSKAGAGEVNALSARGAVALINATRTTLVINRMDKDHAERLGIADDERRRYFSVADDKHNRAPPEKADWFRMASVDLRNCGIGAGDSVGVAEPWKLPDPFDDITTRDLAAVQRAIAEGEWREHETADQWAGVAVAQALSLDAGTKKDRTRIKSLLHTWVKNGMLKIVERNDATRRPRKWIEIDKWVDAPPP